MKESPNMKSRKVQVRLDPSTEGMLKRIRETDPKFCLSKEVRTMIAKKAEDLGVRKTGIGSFSVG